MIALGNTKIDKIYLGNTEVKRVYKGNNIVFDSKPYDAEIEYLGGTRTQWIDTLVLLNQDSKIECEYLVSNDSYNSVILGCADSASATDAKNGALIIRLTNGASRYGFGNGSNTVYQNDTYSQLNTEYKVYFDKNNVYINDTLVKTLPTSTWTATNTLWLFARNGGTSFPMVGYIKYCKIWNDTTLVRDYIPVRIGQVGYMYDKVSGQLFGNSGSGDFVLGNDI